jgi:uncharacterized protein (TIGR01777 family)
MNILITGASGLVGSALTPFLEQRGHRVSKLSRSVSNANAPRWNPADGMIDLAPAGPLEAVVHLAGENIAQPWKRAVRKRIRESRVQSTKLLSETLAASRPMPRVLICASATGYYGDRGDELLDEQSLPGHGFLPEICREWEAAADPARAAGIRVVHLRFGIILSPRGGALKRMLPVFKMGLGGKLGDGHYYWSWLANDDVLGVVDHVLKTESISGPINTVTPFPVTNREFTKALAAALKRPAFFTVPPFLLEVFLGQMAHEALLCSFRVAPVKLLQSGFQFRYGTLEAALRHLLGRGKV